MALLSPLRLLLSKQLHLAGSRCFTGSRLLFNYLELRAASFCSVRKKCSRRQSKSTPTQRHCTFVALPGPPIYEREHCQVKSRLIQACTQILLQDFYVTVARSSLKLRAYCIKRQKAAAHRVASFKQRLLRFAVDKGLNLRLQMNVAVLEARVCRKGDVVVGGVTVRRKARSSPTCFECSSIEFMRFSSTCNSVRSDCINQMLSR